MVDFNDDDLPDDNVFAPTSAFAKPAAGGAPPDLSAEQLADQAEAIKLAAIRSEPRDIAIERGRLAGEHESDQRNETGEERRLRVARAQAYAAWEYDGKPLNYDNRYQKEFGVNQIHQLHEEAWSRIRGGTDQKKGKKA